MNDKNLQEKLKNLTRLLEKETAEKNILEQKLKQRSSFSFKKLKEFLGIAQSKISDAFEGRKQMEEVQVSVSQKSALEESLSDEIDVYKNKIAQFKLDQLEDIFLHIDKEAHPERFAAIIAEIQKKLPA